jgi:hypothetical protein
MNMCPSTVNVKLVRKCGLFNTTSSKNILNKSIYTIYVRENTVNTGLTLQREDMNVGV